MEFINSQDVEEVDQSATNVSERFMNAINNYKKNTMLDLDTDNNYLGIPSSMIKGQLGRSISKARKSRHPGTFGKRKRQVIADPDEKDSKDEGPGEEWQL